MKFKVGQRVAVYDSRVLNNRQVGKIASLKDPNGFMKEALWITGIERKDHYGNEIIVNPKQCRRIKTK